MKITLAVLLASLLLIPVVAFGYTPGSGFQDSPHDFDGVEAGSGTGVFTGQCTFCHTPHQAQETRLLWNHTLSANDFSWTDVTSTIGGTLLPTISTSYTGPTKFCLSCHDGSVAVGDIAWFNKQAWTGASALDADKHGVGDIYNIADPLTGDMDGNHPVAHPYPYQGAANMYNGVTTGSGVYMTDFASDPTSSGIRLFNDSGGVVKAGALAGNTGIECTSCHGVHNESGVVQDEPLLRGKLGGANEANYICTKCHTR